MGFKGFYHLSRSWYGEECIHRSNYKDEVVFGIYHHEYDEEYSTSGEMAMRWYELKHIGLVPKLEVFDDGFALMSGELKEVIEGLRKYHDVDMSPADFCNMLLSFGYIDLTKEAL